MEQGTENILPSTKGVDLMEIFPMILNVNNETFKITPSEYIKEMSLTMNERHKKLTRISNTVKPEKLNYPPQFRIMPHILMFQRFETMTTNCLILEIKNIGKGLLPLKMHCPNSIYFSANHFGTPVLKLAPGLSAEYEITFTPKEERDYHHYLVFNSKEHTFQVPIVAIGPRPMLDVPDQIILNPSPVKIASSKYIVVRNIGNASAVFNFIPQGPHFQVTPAKGVLGINDSVLLNVTFESAKVKEVTESLHLSLESGEKIHVTLHGSAENMSIRLDKNSVVHEDTYIGLKRYKIVRLVNNSSHVAKFCWKKNKTEKEDWDIIESMKEKFKELSELEKLKDTKVIFYGLSNAEKHKISCERILKDEFRLLEKEEFKFVDDIFAIMPQSGEVWPKSSMEMIISFKPKVCGLARAEAYLDVCGRDSRLPLRMKGTGQGPNIILNVKSLDIDYIFLCSLHTYEITVENIGDIPGTIEYVMEPLVFGGKAEIIPDSRYLKAGEIGGFVISFTSNRPGEFTEKISFNIKESGEKLCLVFKGNIVSPTLNFDEKQILFGNVPIGVPVKREVHLHNLSMVPVEFSLRVSPDGEFPSISCEAFRKFSIKPVMPQNPKEFEVDPEESVVEPFSTKKVMVILTANKVGKHEKELIVELWDSESRSKSCLINYNAQLASMTAVPEELVIPFCFINYPYTKSIVIKNNSSVSGFFYIVPRDPNADVPMTFSATISQGLLEPYATVQIEMTVITSALGRQILPIKMLTFGIDEPEEICTISCVGQGPVVTVKPLSLNWGDVILLESVHKTLQFTNESPIPAQVSLSLMKGNLYWSVDPAEVMILAQKSVTVNVSLFLKDCGKFQDNLKVNIYNGKASQVPLHATGVGSSLVVTPKISPNYYLGTLFSQKSYQFEILIENKGNKSHSIVWSTNADFKSFLNEKLSSSREQTFRIQPQKLDLMSGETKSIFLEVFSKTVGQISRMFYCFVNLGNSAKELHMTSEVSADFVEPMITCDKNEMVFWTNNGIDSNDVKVEDTICMHNTSMLPLVIETSTSHPFCLEKEPGNWVFSLSHSLDGLQSTELTVKFLSSQSQSKFSKTFNGKLEITFQGHSKKIIIPILGKISHPNVSIHPKNVDLGYLQVGTDACASIKLVNMSPLTVCYSISWMPSLSYVVPFERAASVHSLAPGLSEESDVQMESEHDESSLEVTQKLEAESLTSENPGETSQTLSPPIKPVPRMPEIQVSSSDVKAMLFPITRDYYTYDTELVDAYLMAPTNDTNDPDPATNFVNFCDITPFYGTLEPHGSQILTVSFSSNTPVQLHAQALLRVESGPEEIITINATSSDVDFQLSSTVLDFGKQLFCETKSQVLRIQNIASMPFPFLAQTENECECEMEVTFPLGKGVVTVSPSKGTVNSFDTVELIVRYHPGTPGKFENNFQLQIAHLDPIIIKVKGIGVFPQVYLMLPRPEILKITPDIGYSAVASITPDWILTGSLFTSGLRNSNPIKPYRSRESNVDDILEHDSNEEKWELIKHSEFLPSEIDIYLAVERILAYNLILNDTNNAIFAVYARTIPGFSVPAYDLDFGVCAIGCAVEQKVTIMNFGPLPVIIYGIFDSHLKEEGIYIRLKNRNELKCGACISFTVTFHPKKSKYKKKYFKLESMFYFEIYHGPKIPIRILAEVTFPHVLPSMYSINFYEAVCGCCKVINLRLKNPGLLPARWFMSIKTKEEMYQKEISDSGKSVFYLDYYSGVLNPEEYGSVKVFFKPDHGDSFSAVLSVQVSKGLENLKILLQGNGVEPKLNISKKVLNFKSTLPFPNKAEKIFTVCNSSPFPIEFYFLEFDDQIFEEEKILRAVILYYEANEILLPVRQPGDGLPIEIIDFYNMLLDALNAKFIEDERYKMLEEREKENSEESVVLSIDQLNPVQVSSFDKKKKKVKKLSRSRTSMETTRESFGSSMRDLYVAPIYEQKTPEEIQYMLEDYIRYGLSKDLTYDPVQAALKTLLPPEKEEEYRDGTLIICHGAPNTNSVLLANRLSIFTNMLLFQALSIDNIVLTEAAFGRCEAGLMAKDLIEQAYYEFIGIEEQDFPEHDEWGENEGSTSEGEDFESNFEKIEGKFNALIQLRESFLSGKRKNGRPETAKSDISKLDKGQSAFGKPQMNLNAPIANISEELVVEILRYRLALEVEDGVIIEGLQSTLISSTTNALISLLKAAGNVKDIIVVFFLSDYDQYYQHQLNIQAEQELAKLYLKEEILKVLEEEPEEVFESLNLNPEDANSFREAFLTKRHDSHIVFEKKKAAFYEVERLKRQALKNGLPVSLRHFTFEEATPGDKKEKEYGKKKEVGKGSKTSDTTSRRTESGTKSVKVKRDSAENDFLAFEMEFTEMRTIIENWDQRLGALVMDSTTEVKTKKGQTPRKVDSAAVTSPKIDRGVFLWLVDLSRPYTNSFLGCCCHLKTTLEERHTPSESDSWPQTIEEIMTFSVVSMPPKRSRNPLVDVFTISATENVVLAGEDQYEDMEEYSQTSLKYNLNRSVSSLSMKSRKKDSRASRRRKTDSRMSADLKSLRSRKTIPGSEEFQVKPRWILMPGERQSFKVKYYPVEIGSWTQDYSINLVACGKEEIIHCEGICDFPRIETTPSVIFPLVYHNKPLNNIFSAAYYYSEECYDFGCSIISDMNEKRKSKVKKVVLNLVNISTLPVDMCFVFGENGSTFDVSTSENFTVEPNKIWIPPEGRKEVVVATTLARVGPVSETLLFVIKDNPQVERFNLACEGVKASVVVSPQILQFDRLLLHRKDFRRVVLSNDNTIPLYFSLKDVDKFPPQIYFTHVSGCILSLGSFSFQVHYNATEVQLISGIPVEIEVFDSQDFQDPVQVLELIISAEAYDAALDITFANVGDDHIDFGDIRVENQYSMEFYLKNVGKYQLAYKFDVDTAFLSESGNEEFYLIPQDAKLPPGKLFPVKVIFMAQTEVSWKRETLFRLTLVEPFSADELIAAIPIEVSARSHFSRYEIKPSDLLNFGHIPIGRTTTNSLIIENKGHFPLTYWMELQSHNTAFEERENLETKKSLSTASKEKGRKNNSFLKAGIFDIIPNSGTAEPGQRAVVTVTCCPLEMKTFEENLTVFVSESLPHLKKGTPITMLAESCLPKIRFDDYKILFREHIVCKNESDLSCRNKMATYTVYTANNNQFSFKNVCVGKTAEARICLENAGLIDCKVNAFVGNLVDEERKSSNLSTRGSEYFTISPEKLIVEPYNAGSLLLTFKPDALEVYKGKLTIVLEMPDSFVDEMQVFDLYGNGIFPQIEITEPNTKLPEGQALVNFPPTSPGHTSCSSIAFTNTGVLDCKVIIEVYKQTQTGVFTLSPKESTEKMLKIWELTKPIDLTAIVSLSPGQTAEFDVMFSPKEVQSYTSQIKLFIVDNPFENWCYRLAGEVFLEEVVVEKIRTTMPFLKEENRDKSAASAGPGQYYINFADCYVKKTSKAMFRLSNKTEKDYFKFEWEEAQGISVSPAVGHLYPNSYKEILLEFHPEEPMELEDAPLSCTLNKILFGNPPETSWDSRLIQYQKQFKGDSSVRSNDKNSSNPILDTIMVSGEEPEHEVIPESSRPLYINLSGIADYTRLTCETTKIAFKNTFMFQTRMYSLALENSGNVALEYKVSLKSVTVWPLKEDKNSQVDEQQLMKLYRTNSRPQSSNPSNGNCRVPLRRPRPLSSVVDFHRLTRKGEEQSYLQALEETKTTYFNPFSIENAMGRIQSKEKAFCNIVFSPMDINEYKTTVVIQVANLHPECSLPEIEVTASSIMPYCHFDVPESDYLESGRREYTRPGPIGFSPGVPLHPDTKTIEVKVLGVGTTTPIKFHGINPTEDDYTFSWVNITQCQPDVVPSFHCSTVDGWIRAGRQQLMVFNFISQKIGITESFWKFSIPKYGVETPFLFVGDVREPAICFLSTHVNLLPTLIGSSSSGAVVLANHEEKSFEFYFIPESLYSEGRLNALVVEPLSGKIPSNSEINIRLTFTGKTAGKTQFSLKCRVKSVKEPFVITVEATTYMVQPLVTFEDLQKVKHYPEIHKESIIDFGSELSPHIPETITITLTSLSKTSFYYYWEYNERVLEMSHCSLRFSMNNGHVTSFSRGKCDLTIVFQKNSSLVNFPVHLKIRRGPTFDFLINGRASTPLCEFSFTRHDFGYCFLQEKDICFNETSLCVTNKSTAEFFLECVLPDSSAFSYSLPDPVINPLQEIVIPIYFHPKDYILYEDTLKFIVNGTQERLVHVSGCGAEFKVILVDAEDTTISLGAVKIGRTSVRKFSLVNKSLATATLLLGFFDQLPVNGSYLVSQNRSGILNTQSNLSEDHRLTDIIKIVPSTVFKMKPQETIVVTVTYTPQKRSPLFSEMVYLQCQEKAEPLCMLTGCCLGPEISLDRYFLNFGAVVECCTSNLKLKLVNSGSIGARFEWNTTMLTEYCIYPASGYCSPESDVTITVTFCPSAVQNCIKRKVECKLYLSENETYPSLSLGLMGDCITLPGPEEVLDFECCVRETVTKEIEIQNPSGSDWHLIPIISGEYFRGFEVLVVPSLSSATYQLEYHPLTMADKWDPHAGSVFFRLPSGQGLLYQMKGVSLPPNAEEKIERDVPCKTKYVELLKIKNWLQSPQRFKTIINQVEPGSDDPTASCTGFEYLEVPATAQKEYSLNFFAYNIGYKRYNVKFINEESGEYVWFDFGFNVLMCGPLEVITLKSGVRQSCPAEVKLENPLQSVVRFQLETTSTEVDLGTSVYEVPPQKSVCAPISFTPLHPGDKTEMLTVSCAELGVFPRELRLISMDVVPEPTTTYETSLGTSQTREFSIKNFSRVTATFNFKVESDDFDVIEQATVSAGETTNIEVIYEPSEIGSTKATFVAESEQAGNFIFPLLGMCVKPLVKGPFTIKPGSGINIPFKNVFKKPREFYMYVDNPGFFLKTTQETLSPKEEYKIFVGFQKVKYLERISEYKNVEIQPQFPLMGQLVIECFNPYVKWQFYLKGVLDQ